MNDSDRAWARAMVRASTAAFVALLLIAALIDATN